MGLKTPLYEVHVAEGAKIVDFGGWDMPLHYGSQIEEHHAVRRDAGMFDVSHMGVIDVEGPRAREFLRHLLANDVAKLPPGKGLYSVLLREDGKILDDLIVFFVAPERFRLVVNAGTRDKDLSWMRARAAAFGITVTERRDLAMIAIQGPNARAKSVRLFSAPDAAAVLGLGPFESATLGGWFVSRTGYTGEDGFEIALAAADAPRIWQALHAVGIAAAGLGARDTLRLEAGMNLYGSDMDAARGARRAAQPPAGDHRQGTGRGHQRHIFPHPEPLHRAGPRAAGMRRLGAGADSRQGAGGAGGQAAVRATRPAADRADRGQFAMSKIPDDLQFTRSHEWVRRLPDGALEIGITDHAQGELGDLVFVEVPHSGRGVKAGEACAVVESVKAASDVYAPVSGTVIAGNAELAAKPELLNQDPYGSGWLMRIEPAAGVAPAVLMSAAEYSAYVAETAH